MVQLLAEMSFAHLMASILTRVLSYRLASRVPRPLTAAAASLSRIPVLLMMYRLSGRSGSRVPVVKVVGISVAMLIAKISSMVYSWEVNCPTAPT